MIEDTRRHSAYAVPAAGRTRSRERGASPGGGRSDSRSSSSVSALLGGALAGCARIRNPEGWSGSVVQGNSLFTGTTRGEIISLDKTSGETNWRFGLQGEEDDRAIYGTPAVSSDSLYVGGYDGLLYALSLDVLDVLDVEEKWIERLDGPVVGGAVLFDGLVVVGSEVDDPVDDNEGMVYAFDAGTGERQWRFPVEGKVWSTPAIADGLVIFGSLDHRVYALSLEGNHVWTFDTGGAVAAPPVVARGRVYVGSRPSTPHPESRSGGSTGRATGFGRRRGLPRASFTPPRSTGPCMRSGRPRASSCGSWKPRAPSSERPPSSTET